MQCPVILLAGSIIGTILELRSSIHTKQKEWIVFWKKPRATINLKSITRYMRYRLTYLSKRPIEIPSVREETLCGASCTGRAKFSCVATAHANHNGNPAYGAYALRKTR